MWIRGLGFQGFCSWSAKSPAQTAQTNHLSFWGASTPANLTMSFDQSLRSGCNHHYEFDHNSFIAELARELIWGVQLAGFLAT